MSNRTNHRRGERRRMEHGPRWANPDPGKGCNATHVARARRKRQRERRRRERRAPIPDAATLLDDERHIEEYVDSMLEAEAFAEEHGG